MSISYYLEEEFTCTEFHHRFPMHRPDLTSLFLRSGVVIHSLAIRILNTFRHNHSRTPQKMRKQLSPFLGLIAFLWIGWNHNFQLPIARGRVDEVLTGVTVERRRSIGKEMRQESTKKILWVLFDIRALVSIVKVWRWSCRRGVAAGSWPQARMQHRMPRSLQERVFS
jgi:hypothetical protein